MDLIRQRRDAAFTLVELLVVITIIAILMALLFPAFKGVQNQAKRTQAKNDVTQIVTAVSAFYTEYGRYPTTATSDAAAVFGRGATSNDMLFNALRGNDPALNPKAIIFINPPDVKDSVHPRSGISTSGGAVGQYFDPWGLPYAVALDADYNNQVKNPYGNNNGAGGDPLNQGAIAWSLGSDGKGGSGNKNTGDADDDVISWQ